MYTKQQSNEYDNYYDIYDKEGEYICTVIGDGDAIALLSHLNRN